MVPGLPRNPATPLGRVGKRRFWVRLVAATATSPFRADPDATCRSFAQAMGMRRKSAKAAALRCRFANGRGGGPVQSFRPAGSVPAPAATGLWRPGYSARFDPDTAPPGRPVAWFLLHIYEILVPAGRSPDRVVDAPTDASRRSLSGLARLFGRVARKPLFLGSMKIQGAARSRKICAQGDRAKGAVAKPAYTERG